MKRVMTSTAPWMSVALLLALLGSPPAKASTGFPAEVSESSYVNAGGSLNQITCMAWAPDGSRRLFITEKDGAVHIVHPDSPNAPTTFYTFAPRTFAECGVLSICFDPHYSTNKFVYIFYTHSDTEQRIVRLRDDNGTGTDLTNIMTGLPTAGSNHNGGSIGISSDHNGQGWYLYWSIGDNINMGNGGANLTSLAAKCGRAKLDGSVANDNPFFDGLGPNNDFIWARGLRNPFTFTFQPGTQQLWINVVGNNQEQIFKVNRGDHAGWNLYENNQPAGFISPVIKYRTNNSDQATIAGTNGAVRGGNIVTITTTAPHLFRQGERITMATVSDASFDGTYYVASVPSATTFTYSQTGPDASSGGGTTSTLNLGGCVTGGCFYDSTGFSPAYRGNFFFGDINPPQRIFRAALDGSNNALTVDSFATGNGQSIDMSVGPDGNIYYATYLGAVRRYSYNYTAQQLIVTPTNLRIPEGGSGVVFVRLAQVPGADVTVNVDATAGDADISVSGGALTFTTSNWATPQAVTVSAAQDADGSNDSATLTVSSAGLTTQTVAVTAVDDDLQGLVLSTCLLSVNEQSNAAFTARLEKAPASAVTVDLAASGDPSVSCSPLSLTFTPDNWATPQTVTVTAADDGDNTNDVGLLTLTSPVFAARTVTVTAFDNDNAQVQITSTPVTAAVEGAPYSYDVNATGNPAPTYSLTTAPVDMTINSTTGVISWTPTATGIYSVTVQASNGLGTPPTQSFTITVNADTLPLASLTSPRQGDTVSGNNAEFFGDGFDDVGCTKAEFYVDGALNYTDNNSGGHYHHGGAHFLWDSTAVSNGNHALRLVVTDTKGQTSFMEVTITVSNNLAPVISSQPTAEPNPVVLMP